jgi:anti-sigma B factor antagonist
VLLSAQKIMNKQGDMVVKNCSDEIKDIFEVTGFSDILTIE